MDVDETVSHVLAVCPYYAGARDALTVSLSKLRLSRTARAFIDAAGLSRIILMPERIPQISKQNMRRVHRRTALYINRIYNLRPKHF